MIERTGEALNVIAAVGTLFHASGSEVEELTEAVLVMVLPSLGAVTRIVMGGAAPGGRVLEIGRASWRGGLRAVGSARVVPWKVTRGGTRWVRVIGAPAVVGPG